MGWRRVEGGYGRWMGDVPRVTRVGCRATSFADDLVCILDALAQVSSEGRVRRREGREEGKGSGLVVSGRKDPSRAADLPSRPHPTPRRRDCLGVCRVLKWTK